jgi:hypothetical protein
MKNTNSTTFWPTLPSSLLSGSSSSERVLSTQGRGKKQGQTLLPGSKKALRNALIKEKRAQRATRSGAAAKGQDGGLGFDAQSLVEELIKVANQGIQADLEEIIVSKDIEYKVEDDEEDEDDGPAEEDRITAIDSGAIDAFSTPPLSRYGRKVALSIGRDFQTSFETKEFGKGEKRCIVYIPRLHVKVKGEIELSSDIISRARQRAKEFASQASGEAFDTAVADAKTLKNKVRDKHTAQKLAGKKFSGKLRKIFVKKAVKTEREIENFEKPERNVSSKTPEATTFEAEVSDNFLKNEEEEDDDKDDDELSDSEDEPETSFGLGSRHNEEPSGTIASPEWEVYTRGIGSRLLLKMGFTGGALGVDRGMSRITEPIEAHLKNDKKGLGLDF